MLSDLSQVHGVVIGYKHKYKNYYYIYLSIIIRAWDLSLCATVFVVVIHIVYMYKFISIVQI